ncbi:MAG: response regulator, partial [Alphaproteobacteria bacterium]
MNILIVDAHWATRAGLARHLLDMNPSSKIFEAENLDLALQALASKTSFDLCLFNFSIPEIEPLSELKRLRQTAPTIPIIVMTATDSRRWALRAIGSGAAGYVLKSSPRAALD